jgi:hypothetical protein
MYVFKLYSMVREGFNRTPFWPPRRFVQRDGLPMPRYQCNIVLRDSVNRDLQRPGPVGNADVK